jgi:hypothetical protein
MGLTCETAVDGSRTHQVADLNGVDSGDSIDQGNDFGVAKIDGGLFDCRLVRFNGGFRGAQRLRVGIQLALRNRVNFRFGNVTLHVQVGIRHLRFRLRQLSPGLIEHRLKWTRINLKEHLVLFDECSLVIIPANQVTAHLRRNLGVDVAFERPYPLALDRHVLLNDRCYFHLSWRRG